MPIQHIVSAEMMVRRASGPRWSRFLKGTFLTIATTATTWRQRALDRARLRELEPHLLDDIGVSPERRDREVRKPFWVR